MREIKLINDKNDPFMDTASTADASVICGRKCVGFETNYFDLTCERFTSIEQGGLYVTER